MCKPTKPTNIFKKKKEKKIKRKKNIKRKIENKMKIMKQCTQVLSWANVIGIQLNGLS